MCIDTSLCKGKINYPFEKSVKTITMIAVGAGIAPMIQTLRAIFANYSNGKETGDVSKCNITGVVLMYGAVRIVIPR